MDYRTKLDYSSNRQIRQEPKTFTYLSGGTSFGVPFSALTSGPDPYHSGTSFTYSEIISTFSGNSGNTIYTWFDAGMEIARVRLSAITPTNSGITQSTGNVFTASTTTVIDGNTVALAYSGVNFTITPLSFINMGSYYSGTVYTPYLNFISANTLDFTGRTIWVDVSGITRTDSLIVNKDATFLNIGSQSSYGVLHYTSGGTLTTNTSDKRLKTNITHIENALTKVINLNGVYYNWADDPNGDKRIGFIAQEVNDVVPELVFINNKTVENYMGVHYDNVTPLLVEAIKELVTGSTTIQNFNTELVTQTIIAEDNNIELNFNGNHISSIGGGLTVLYGINDTKSSDFKTDSSGNWTTNTDLKPFGLSIPYYKPTSSIDTNKNVGNITTDNDYLYLKVSENTWKRIKLEDF